MSFLKNNILSRAQPSAALSNMSFFFFFTIWQQEINWVRGRTKTRVHMQTQNVAVIMHFERPSPDSSWDCFHDAMMTPLQTRCLLSVRCNGIQNNYITVGQGAHLVPGSTFLLPHGCGDDKANHVKLALAFTSIAIHVSLFDSQAWLDCRPLSGWQGSLITLDTLSRFHWLAQRWNCFTESSQVNLSLIFQSPHLDTLRTVPVSLNEVLSASLETNSVVPLKSVL